MESGAIVVALSTKFRVSERAIRKLEGAYVDVTLSAFKTNIKSTIQGIVSTHQPVIVKKDRRSSVVLMPLEDYQAVTEAKYLLNSPANAARLLRGIEEIEQIIAGGGRSYLRNTSYPGKI